MRPVVRTVQAPLSRGEACLYWPGIACPSPFMMPTATVSGAVPSGVASAGMIDRSVSKSMTVCMPNSYHAQPPTACIAPALVRTMSSLACDHAWLTAPRARCLPPRQNAKPTIDASTLMVMKNPHLICLILVALPLITSMPIPSDMDANLIPEVRLPRL